MPIYEYRCASCGCQQEYLQKVSDPVFTTCPQCGRETYKKLLTAAGFQLKGSGWYATDFKGNNARPPAEKPAEKPAAEAKTEDGSKDGAAASACGAGACPTCS